MLTRAGATARSWWRRTARFEQGSERMSSEVAAIEKVLQVYFDGLYEGDTKKLGEAFHPASHLYSAGPDGKAADMPRADWFKMVEGRKSAKANGSARADRIVSIDFSGPATAFAKVECQIPPRYFTDYLTLLKVDGRWQVISKSFHTLTRE
jgi:hypothetical protein